MITVKTAYRVLSLLAHMLFFIIFMYMADGIYTVTYAMIMAVVITVIWKMFNMFVYVSARNGKIKLKRKEQ